MARRKREPAEVIETARAREALERKNELAELRDLLALPEMRSFMWRLMAESKMFQTRFSPNAAVMGFNEGFADMGVKVYNEIIEADAQAWIVMQQESLDRALEKKALLEAEEAERKEYPEGT
jgi:hypothetical protein